MPAPLSASSRSCRIRATRFQAGLEQGAAVIAEKIGLALELKEIWYQPPIAFDPACVAAVAKGAAAIGQAAMPIVSGAGHDACNISTVAPTGMIFVPCAGGISHNEVEDATPADCTAGCNVLLHAILDRAQAR